jgi:flagellar basal body-associated protein FliL
MSKLSEQRENEQHAKPKSGPRWIWIVAALVVVGAAWGGYDYFYYSKASTLDSFAKCLNAKGVRMYGAWWCPHCANQKEAFGYAFQYVNYTECGEEGKPHSVNDQCKQAGIKNFPTWQFADGSRTEGELPLADLSQKSGCRLP